MAALSDGSAAPAEPDSPQSPAIKPGGLNKGGSKAVSMANAVPEEDPNINHKHLTSGRYDFKLMRSYQAIEDSFKEKLVALYGVEDEDALHDSIQDLCFGDLCLPTFEEAKLRKKLAALLKKKPWPKAKDADRASVIDEVMAELGSVNSGSGSA